MQLARPEARRAGSSATKLHQRPSRPPGHRSRAHRSLAPGAHLARTAKLENALARSPSRVAMIDKRECDLGLVARRMGTPVAAQWRRRSSRTSERAFGRGAPSSTRIACQRGGGADLKAIRMRRPERASWRGGETSGAGRAGPKSNYLPRVARATSAGQSNAGRPATLAARMRLGADASSCGVSGSATFGVSRRHPIEFARADKRLGSRAPGPSNAPACFARPLGRPLPA